MATNKEAAVNESAVRVKAKWVPRYMDLGAHAWIDWFCDHCGYVRTGGWEESKEGKKPGAKFCEMCGAEIR